MIEYSANSRNRRNVEAFRSLAAATGLGLEHIVELAARNELGSLFDPETRSLGYRNGRRVSHGGSINPRVAIAQLDAMRASWGDERSDPRVALAQLAARRRSWDQ